LCSGQPRIARPNGRHYSAAPTKRSARSPFRVFLFRRELKLKIVLELPDATLQPQIQTTLPRVDSSRP
jgi:hypothetical protein